MAWTFVGTDDAPQAAPPPARGKDATMQPVQTPGDALRVNVPGKPAQAPQQAAGVVPPEANDLFDRVRKAEGTAAGDGFVFYGGQSFKPGKEFPQWDGLPGPKGKTHAAGPGQWQPDTWNGLKPDFEAKFGRAPDFSSMEDQKAMVWLNAAKTYGGEDKLRKDIADGKLDTSKLSSQWAGFNGRGGNGWSVVGAGKWSPADKDIAAQQSRPDTQVMWMSPSEYKEMVDRAPGSEKRRSLLDKITGEEEIAIPTLDVKADKSGRVKIVDQDGYNRADFAEKQGVGLIPVAVHGMGKDTPSWIEDQHGNVRRFDFTPVPKATVEPSRAERFGTGVRDIIGGAAQLATHLVPAPIERGINSLNNTLADAGVPLARIPEGGVDQMERDREGRIEDERKALGETGTDWWRVGGRVAGGLAATASIPAVGSGIGGAIATGAIQGGAGAVLDPVTSEGNYWASKLGQVGMGGAAGGVLGAGTNAMVSALAPAARAGVSKLENKAREVISQRFADRAAGSGAAPAEMADAMAFARSEGQPMALPDFPELAGLAGSVSRQPGEAGARMKQFFSDRRAGAMDRLDNILARYLPTGSVKRTVEELANERAKAAAPLYREAFEGGSLAPLEKQFQKEWNSAAAVAKNAEQNAARIANELNTALAKKATAGNVYSSSAANRATRFAQDKIADQRKIATEARNAEQSALARLRRAQEDGTANAPGAVWSPTIQRLVSNPRVQVGIRKGMKIERDLADAEGRPMNLREYAIIGTDEAGEPIVGAVPNMRLLAAAKKGLDSIVADMRSPAPPWRLTEEGRAVDKLRRTLLDELYTINPKYKEANELWSGGAEEIKALVDGQRALDRRVSVEDVRDQLTALPERARDFFRLGVADEARKDLLNSALTADKSKAIVNSEGAREKLRHIIGGPEEAGRFVRAIENERTMFNTERSVIGGSQTAERAAEDYGVNGMLGIMHMGRAAIDAAHGRVLSAIASGLRGVREFRGPNNKMNNPALMNEVSRYLTNPNLGMNYSVGRGAPPMLPQLPVARAPAGPVRNAFAGAIGAGGQALAPAAGVLAAGP